jgi:CheY-like chemotaxis protein
MMPEKSGISIYTSLKKDSSLRDIPVLIISGVSRQGEFDFRSYVPDTSIPPPAGYLEKPIVVDQYLQLISDLISPIRSPERGKATDA